MKSLSSDEGDSDYESVEIVEDTLITDKQKQTQREQLGMDITANLRLDKKSIKHDIDYEKIEKMRKEREDKEKAQREYEIF